MGTLKNKRGLTLIEMVTVVAILGLLATILGFSFQGWLAKFKVEDETKRFYSDLMDARARAMQKKRVTFVDLASNRYRTFEDTNPMPDGDETLNIGTDRLVADSVSTWPGGLPYTIDMPTLGGVTQIIFDKEGLANIPVTIWLTSNFSPDFDCITISTTRIRMGSFNGGTCQEK